MGLKRSEPHGYCERHHKYLYTSRARARVAARACSLRYGGKKHPYRCKFVEGMWHIGSLSPIVMAGEMTRGEYYG